MSENASAGAPPPPAAPAAAPVAAPAAPKSPPAAPAGTTTPPQSAAPGGSSPKPGEGQTPATAAPTDGTAADLLDLKDAGAKYVEITIDGKAERMKLTDALALVRKGKAADKRFEEASAIKKAADKRDADFDRFEQMIGSDEHRETVLERLLTPEALDKLAEGRIARKAKLAAMTPDERRALSLTERERAIGEREQKAAAQADRERAAERAKAARPEIERALTESLKGAGLEGDHAMRDLKRRCRDHIADTGKGVTRELMAQFAKEQAEEHEKRTGDLRTGVWTQERDALSKLEGEDLVKAVEEKLGAEALEKIRKADLARFKSQQAAAAPRQSNGQFTKPNAEPARRKTVEEILGRR